MFSGQGGQYYFVFVADGNGRRDAETVTYEPISGFKMLGHVGWVPASVLTWNHPAARLVSASFCVTTMKESGLPLLDYKRQPKSAFKFKPTIIAASSGIIKL